MASRRPAETDRRRRKTAATAVFSWKRPEDWSQQLRRTFSDELPDRLFAMAADFDHERFYSDNLDWLDGMRAEAGLDFSTNLDEVIASRFGEAFHAFHVYHACRPHDPLSYASRGLQMRDPDGLRAHAERIFGRLGISRAEIDEACRGKRIDEEAGELFLALDDRDFAEHAGHYLIYGGEYLLAVAAGLHKTYGEAPRRELAVEGVPTIFEWRCPTAMVSFHCLQEFAGVMLSNLFQAAATGDDLGSEIDFTITVRRGLPADEMISHYHPRRIRDPQRGFAVYRPPISTCALCATGLGESSER